MTKMALSGVPDKVEIGEDKVRVAIVDCVNSRGTKVKDADVLFNLSGNKEAFENWRSNWQPTDWAEKIWYHHDVSFRKIREQVFDLRDMSRAKVVIVIMNGYADDRAKTNEEAWKLHRAGILVYIIFHRDLKERGQLSDEVKTYASHLSALFEIPDHHVHLYLKPIEQFPKIEAALDRDLCTYCRIEEDKSCKPSLRPPGSRIHYFNDKNARCISRVPVTDMKCPKEKCEVECDNQWPWISIRNCSLSCGEITREPIKPPKGMEHCFSTPLKCPNKCTTTTTSSASPSAMTDRAGQDGTEESAKKNVSLIIAFVLISIVVLLIILALIIVPLVIKNRAKKTKEKAKMKLRGKKKVESSTFTTQKLKTTSKSKTAINVSESDDGKDVSLGIDAIKKGANASVESDISTVQPMKKPGKRKKM